jgi:hypothetical protein
MIDSMLTNLLFLLFGLGSAWVGWRGLKHAHASTAWPRTHGTIIGSTTHSEHNGEYEPRRAVITYEYTVAGTTYRSGRVFFGDDMGLLWDKPRQERLAAYPAGRSVTVAYDPAAPRHAVLEAGPNWATYLSVAGPVALVMFGLVNLLARW